MSKITRILNQFDKYYEKNALIEEFCVTLQTETKVNTYH